MRKRTHIFLGAAIGAAMGSSMFWSACYKPSYSSDSDAGTAFRCFATDKPTCPGNLICCAGRMCGDALIDQVTGEPIRDRDTGLPIEGWCVPPREPEDMTTTPFQYWPFPIKPNYYTGTFTDLGLGAVNPDSGEWGCRRDDTNPTPAPSIQRFGEPNDLPGSAINLGTLRIDPDTVMYPGSEHEICPDKSAPNQPDLDVFQFKVGSPAKVIIEAKYKLMNGDLDVGVFRINKNPDTMMEEPQLIQADMTATENSCLEIASLQAGTYYIAVRGSRIIYDMSMPEKYTMNRYTLRAYEVKTSGASCKKGDGGG